jgi:hypothetical protein
MSEISGSALRIEGTANLRRVNGVLCRALRLHLPVPFSGPAQACIVTPEGTIRAECQVTDGQALLDGPSGFASPLAVAATLFCPAGTWSGQALLAPMRCWTIYIAQDKHLDYGWIHPVEQVVARMNTLTDYHLDAARRIGLRWNLDSSIWVEEFLRTRPSARTEQLLAALRTGQFEVGAFWLVPLPGFMGSEELLRSLYYARSLQEELGIPVRTAAIQEAPSLCWGLAMLLSGAGIEHVVKGAFDLRNPHLREREPWPLVTWEGPDGSHVLLRWDCYADTFLWGGYGEAYKLWVSATTAERVQFIEDTAARYAAYADYPVDAILLAGTGFDRYPQTTVVSEFVAWYNAQGWEYPRLVDATWDQYWQDVERQLVSRRDRVKVARGDWGTAWEEWPAQMAHLNTVYRRARETVLAAEALAALAYRLDPASHPRRRVALEAAWRGLLQFTEHDFGGITPSMAADTYDRKATYAYSAAREGSRALESGLSVLANSVPAAAADERLLLVGNSGSYARSDVVEVVMPDTGPYAVEDAESGQELPAQIATRGVWPEQYLSFAAREVPAFGYRCFRLRSAPGAVPLPQPMPAPLHWAAPFFSLSVDPQTGGLSSLYDLVARRELVRPGQALNQYLHFSAGQLYRPQVESVALCRGPVSSSLTVEISCLRARLRSTYVLYENLPYLDIVNELVKEPTEEAQCSWFLFPLNLAAPQYYYDGPAAVLRPGLEDDGGDLLPGAALSSVSVQSLLAAAGPEGSLLLATPDAHLMQFGEGVLCDPLTDSAPHDPLALSLVLHNFTRNDHVLAQGGQRHFAFRYRLAWAPGPFQADVALRLAWGAARPLPATWVTGTPQAPLSAAKGSFLSVEPGNVLVTGCKVAEDGCGWVLRLWECAGRDTQATVDVGRLGASRAWCCDLLERRQGPLTIERGCVRYALPARGLRALRFE